MAYQVTRLQKVLLLTSSINHIATLMEDDQLDEVIRTLQNEVGIMTEGGGIRMTERDCSILMPVTDIVLAGNDTVDIDD